MARRGGKARAFKPACPQTLILHPLSLNLSLTPPPRAAPKTPLRPTRQQHPPATRRPKSHSRFQTRNGAREIRLVFFYLPLPLPPPPPPPPPLSLSCREQLPHPPVQWQTTVCAAAVYRRTQTSAAAWLTQTRRSIAPVCNGFLSPCRSTPPLSLLLSSPAPPPLGGQIQTACCAPTPQPPRPPFLVSLAAVSLCLHPPSTLSFPFGSQERSFARRLRPQGSSSRQRPRRR